MLLKDVTFKAAFCSSTFHASKVSRLL